MRKDAHGVAVHGSDDFGRGRSVERFAQIDAGNARGEGRVQRFGLQSELVHFQGNHTPFGKAVSMELAVSGRRESSKLDKRRRISEAARAVFTEFGYARANMREIAKRAGVATGTLFLYSPDKRNLLLWILNDDLDAVTETSFASLETVHPDDDLLAQLVFVFEARYHYWGADSDLALHALQELIIARDVPGSHLAPYQQRRLILQEH